MALPVPAGRIRRLLQEVESSGRGPHVLAVGGASELAPVLCQQFLRGADPAAVRIGDPEEADVYLHVLVGGPSEADEATLRRARQARVPVIAVAAGETGDIAIPYVFATDVVRVAPGRGFPVDAIARAIAVRLGEDGAPLAARVPLLREAVSEQLVSSLAWKNGVVASAVWIRGSDLPALALNELRLVLRLAQAHGEDDGGRERLPDLAFVVGVAFGLRALARELLGRVPAPGWAVQGAVGYTGTRALGEAARRRFGPPPTPQRAAAARGGP
jgi:uncharacterized protein (DUF697 family)